MRRSVAYVVLAVMWVGVLAPAGAHHVGVFTPKDDELTKNFKDIKFASQAGRFDVALKLFDEGPIHGTMERLEQRLPSGLEDGLRAALRAQNLPEVELRLALFLAFLTRERITGAAARLREPRLPPADRREQARKLLNAAWRYYNLADFVVGRRDPKASVTVRMAFEDATTYLGGTMVDPMWAAGSTPATSAGAPGATAGRAGPDEGKALAALGLMAGALEEVIRSGALTARQGGVQEFLPRR